MDLQCKILDMRNMLDFNDANAKMNFKDFYDETFQDILSELKQIYHPSLRDVDDKKEGTYYNALCKFSLTDEGIGCAHRMARIKFSG